MIRTKKSVFENTWVSCILIFILALGFACLLKYLQYYAFKINDWDTGVYSNLAYNITHGKGYYSEVILKNHMGDHFSPIMYFVSLLYFFKETPLNVLFTLAFAYAAGIAVMFAVFKRILVDSPYNNPLSQNSHPVKHVTCLAFMFVAMLFFVRPLAAALVFEFHPSTLAVPFIAVCFLALHKKSNVLLVVGLLALLTTKENAALSVVGLGLYAYLVLGRKRLGIGLILGSVVWALLVFKVFMPHFQTETWDHYSRIDPFYNIPKKIKYIVYLLACFSFLPLLAPRVLICAVPGIILNLMVSFELQYQLGFHYSDAISIFLIVASVHGFLRLRNILYNLSQAKKVIVVLVFLTPFVIFNKDYIRFLDITRGIEKYNDPKVAQLHAELAPYIADPKIPIATQNHLGPYLSLRDKYYKIKSWNDVDHKGETYAMVAGLPKNTIIIVSPIVNRFGLNPTFFTDIAEDKRLKLIKSSDVMQVYEFVDKN